jgi:hypothetical protein
VTRYFNGLFPSPAGAFSPPTVGSTSPESPVMTQGPIQMPNPVGPFTAESPDPITPAPAPGRCPLPLPKNGEDLFYECLMRGKAVRRETAVPSEADSVKASLSEACRRAEEDKTCTMTHLPRPTSLVGASPFNDKELMALDFTRKIMAFYADCRTGKSYGIAYCILRELRLGRTVFIVICLKTVEQFRLAVRCIRTFLQSVDLDPRVKIYISIGLKKDASLVEELKNRNRQGLPSIVFSWFDDDHLKTLPDDIMANNTAFVDEAQNKVRTTCPGCSVRV